MEGDANQARVTGVGCVCALADNARLFWSRLCLGHTGLSPITAFNTDGLTTSSGGQVTVTKPMRQFGALRHLDNKLSLFLEYAIAEALQDAGYEASQLCSMRVGLVVGISLGVSLEFLGEANDRGGTSQRAEVSENIAGMLGGTTSRLNISEAALVVSTACASGANAIGIGRDMIRDENYDLVICGGVDTLDRVKYLGHSALGTLSPDKVAPFTDKRNGTAFGEGAGIMILESHKKSEGRQAYCKCTGVGCSCDAMHVTAPDESAEGAVHAMSLALADAELTAHQIDHVNLHGSGTVANDAMEALALQKVFFERPPPLTTSIKPAVGHMMGAAGAVEAIATALSIHHGIIPPTLNRGSDGPFDGVTVVSETCKPITLSHAISNSFGFGGCNGVLVFSK
jgi:3-oxoacyl-[acyl-carrier-protein] synthase II